MLPEATGKIFLISSHMRMHFRLCLLFLLGSESSKFRVKCALLMQSNVNGNSQVRYKPENFSSLLFYMNPPMDPFN